MQGRGEWIGVRARLNEERGVGIEGLRGVREVEDIGKI